MQRSAIQSWIVYVHNSVTVIQVQPLHNTNI